MTLPKSTTGSGLTGTKPLDEPTLQREVASQTRRRRVTMQRSRNKRDAAQLKKRSCLPTCLTKTRVCVNRRKGKECTRMRGASFGRCSLPLNSRRTADWRSICLTACGWRLSLPLHASARYEKKTARAASTFAAGERGELRVVHFSSARAVDA